MALFDPDNPRSEEPAAMYRCRELIASCASAIELLEAADAAAALQLIFPGPMAEPEDGQTFTVGELKNLPVWGQLMPHHQVESLLVTRSRAVGCVSEKEGFFRLNWRRQVRDIEYNDLQGRRDVYMFFWDLTSGIAEQLVEAADLNLAVSQIKRLHGPDYNNREDWPTQGRFIMADFVIAWGGSEHAT